MTDEEMEAFIKTSLEKDFKAMQDKPTEEVIEEARKRAKAFLLDLAEKELRRPVPFVRLAADGRGRIHLFGLPASCRLCGGSEVIIHGEAVEPYTTACRCVGGPG